MSAAEKRLNVQQQDTRWWEGYIIRYAVGTVVGGMCVYFILNTLGADAKSLWLMQPNITQLHLDALLDICINDNSQACLVQAQLAQNLYGFNFPQLALLGIYGLAFNYIASAPILVLHATRKFWIFNRNKLIRCNKWLVLLGFGFVAFVILSILYPFGSAVNQECKWLMLAVYSLVLTILMSQIIFLAHEALCPQGSINFYISLHKVRQSGLIDTNSYKHLREHGNAFLLVLLNFLLLFFIITIHLLFPDNYYLLFGAVFLWISPAAYIYFLGHKIESDLIDKVKSGCP
ncbi:hypothetical protein [Oceanisphaera ostreae]|uniref:Beta-carotene 15,15'-monooxygenase n=1 Tax=Oceanisphaera ostreae TaxID=914151 RepID=A0ABW3KH01_9GAMM